MKKLSEILIKKKKIKKGEMDSQSIFNFFNRVIEREFGNKGLNYLKPDFWKNGKLFVKSKNSIWASELWINREDFINKINKEIGSREVREIGIKNL